MLKNIVTNNLTPRKKPETVLKCIDENNYCNEKFTERNGKSKNTIEDSQSKFHRRSNTNIRFIQDIKSNITQQFERLKEFKESRKNFDKILKLKEEELDMKNYNEESSHIDYEKPLEKTKDSPVSNNNYYISKNKYDRQNLTTVKTENKNKNEHSREYDWKEKYENFCHNKNKSVSCHIGTLLSDREAGETNINKISNKFSCNKTSNYLYGEMKIQEQKNQIEESAYALKQKLYKAKSTYSNLSMKELFDLYEDLNECFKSSIF